MKLRRNGRFNEMRLDTPNCMNDQAGLCDAHRDGEGEAVVHRWVYDKVGDKKVQYCIQCGQNFEGRPQAPIKETEWRRS